MKYRTLKEIKYLKISLKHFPTRLNVLTFSIVDLFWRVKIKPSERTGERWAGGVGGEWVQYYVMLSLQRVIKYI